jgi:hypothetical protein
MIKYNQDLLVILNLSVCVKLLYKVCDQSYHKKATQRSCQFLDYAQTATPCQGRCM